SEAIILDGAEPRNVLFPVTTAIAAVSGTAGLQAVTFNPELTRKLTTNTTNPVLATHTRDYSFIAQRDMFYGTLPAKADPVLFTIGKLNDVTIPYPYPAEPMPVRERLAGDGSAGATIKAHA